MYAYTKLCVSYWNLENILVYPPVPKATVLGPQGVLPGVGEAETWNGALWIFMSVRSIVGASAVVVYLPTCLFHRLACDASGTFH